MKPRHKNLFFFGSLRIAAAGIIQICVTGVAIAGTWTGTTSADWNTGTNWSTGVVPTGQNAVINSTPANIATISADITATPVDIIIGSGAGTNGRLDHTAGQAATGAGNWMFVGRDGGTGIYNMSGGASMNVGGRLFIGGQTGSGSTGIVNVNTSGNLAIGSELQIGTNTSTGTLNIDAGSVTSQGWTEIGNGAGSTGNLNLSGGSLVKTGANNIIIGANGSTGNANITGGRLESNNQLWIANNAGSIANVTLSDTGTIVSGDAMAIGRNNLNVENPAIIGTLTMTGGTISKNGGNHFSVGGSPITGDANRAAGRGRFDQSGGALNVNGEIWVGNNPNSVGTYNLSGGTVANNSWVAIGRDSGSGTVNMTGGTWTKNGGGNFIIGASGPATMNQSGGLVDVQSGITWLAETNNATATHTLSGTGEFRTAQMIVGVNGGTDGTLNLDGGTLRTGRLNGQNGLSTVNFNGTQIIATANQPQFINALTNAVIGTGHLRIDSQAFNLASPQTFSGPGGIVKTGSGRLVLSGVNSYSGDTIINDGSLTLSSDSTHSGSVSVADGAEFIADLTFAGDDLEIANLTLGSTVGASVGVNLKNFGNPLNAPINVLGTLNLNGVTNISVIADSINLGQFPVIQYGDVTGTGTFNIDTPLGVDAVVVNNTADKTIDVNVTRAVYLVWDGSTSSTWDTTTANWLNMYQFYDAAAYAEGDPVRFDDGASLETGEVVLNTVVNPEAVLFANNVLDYTLTGTGSISGATGITKTGVGDLTLATANNYTGVTRIAGGTLTVPSLSDGGVAGPLGAATAAPANLVLAAGTLSHAGGDTGSNRGLTLESGGNIIRTSSNLTIGGEIVTTEGRLQKLSAGNLILSNPGTNQLGIGFDAFRADEGTLTLSGSGSQVNTVTGEAWLGSLPNVPANLVLNNTTLNISSWLAVSRGNGEATTTLTLDNSTLTTGNFSSGFAAGQEINTSVTEITMNNSAWSNPGNTNLAENTGNTATMTLNGTSTFTTPNRIFIGQAAGTNGTLVLNDSSSVVHGAGWVSIGYSGSGTLTMNGQSSFVKATGGDFNVADLANSLGVLNINGTATLTLPTSSVYVGRAAGSIGVANQAGGSVVSGDGVFQIGANGNGTWNQSAGETASGGWVAVGRFGPGTGLLDVSGGTFTQSAANRGLLVGEDGTGTLTISGTGTVVSNATDIGVAIGWGGTGAGAVNLNNGGTLVANRIRRGSGYGSFVFNGGTLRAGDAPHAEFFQGLNLATINSGGAIIDSNGQDITIAQALDGTGGLTKTGAGALTLTSINSFAGDTVVGEGVLRVTSPNFGDSATLTINSGAALDLPNAGTDIVGSLVIGGIVQPDGIYGSANTGGAITGTGQIQVGSAVSAYDSWIASFFPGVTDPAIIGAGADPDNDGQPNSLEFALGGNPASGSDNAKIFSFVDDAGTGTDMLLMTIAVRQGTPAFAGSPSPTASHDGVTYAIQGSAGLGTFNAPVTPVATVAPAAPAPAGYEYRTFGLVGSEGLPSKGFLRVEITP